MSDQYGYFSADGREYIITDPRTPRPWHNFLVNDEYLVNLTQLGTGSSFYQPRTEGLRTNLTEDRDGEGGARYVYLRDAESGEYWTVTGAPGLPQMEEWRCRIGLGYQINESVYKGIAASWRVFVPQGVDSAELWTIKIANTGDSVRRISVLPYLEMHLTGGSTLMDFIAVLGGKYDAESKAVFGINSCVKFPPKFKGLLASDTEVAGATVSRDEFLGHYRSYANPLALERGDVHNPEAGTEWLGASLRHEFTLQPGAEVTINCLVGVMDSIDDGKRLIGKYLAMGAPERYFADIIAAADAMCARTVVKTSDVQFDRWMNIWLKHQLAFVAKWGRVIGRGYRDILQDAFGHRITDPAAARACLLEVFSKQFPTGKCIRAWRLPTAELDLQDYADSPSWMIMALSYYLKETADFAVLAEQVSFLNPVDPYVAPSSSATVLEHVVLAQRYLLSELGAHGLSLIRYGDWCDTMNGVGAGGKGESVMLTMQVKWGCDQLAELATKLGDAELAQEMSAAAAQLKDAINAKTWDGEWYLRAFDDEGLPVGSQNPPPQDCGEGKIFVNPQSWSIISDVADAGRKESAINAAQKYLNVGYGMILNWPVFTALRPRIGQMTAMSPGFYENGSVYVHGNCFWVYALGVAGRGQESWDALRAILPDTDNKPNADTEPFIVPNYYIGPNYTRRAQRNLYLSGWRTGSAAWLYMTGIELILGVSADYDGLRINPSLPTGWTDCAISRPFRGDTYEISISNPSGQPGAVQEITIDGVKITGDLIVPIGDGGVHVVRVVMW